MLGGSEGRVWQSDWSSLASTLGGGGGVRGAVGGVEALCVEGRFVGVCSAEAARLLLSGRSRGSCVLFVSRPVRSVSVACRVGESDVEVKTLRPPGIASLSSWQRAILSQLGPDATRGKQSLPTTPLLRAAFVGSESFAASNLRMSSAPPLSFSLRCSSSRPSSLVLVHTKAHSPASSSTTAPSVAHSYILLSESEPFVRVPGPEGGAHFEYASLERFILTNIQKLQYIVGSYGAPPLPTTRFPPLKPPKRSIPTSQTRVVDSRRKRAAVGGGEGSGEGGGGSGVSIPPVPAPFSSSSKLPVEWMDASFVAADVVRVMGGIGGGGDVVKRRHLGAAMLARSRLAVALQMVNERVHKLEKEVAVRADGEKVLEEEVKMILETQLPAQGALLASNVHLATFQDLLSTFPHLEEEREGKKEKKQEKSDVATREEKRIEGGDGGYTFLSSEPSPAASSLYAPPPAPSTHPSGYSYPPPQTTPSTTIESGGGGEESGMLDTHTSAPLYHPPPPSAPSTTRTTDSLGMHLLYGSMVEPAPPSAIVWATDDGDEEAGEEDDPYDEIPGGIANEPPPRRGPEEEEEGEEEEGESGGYGVVRNIGGGTGSVPL